MPLSIPEIAQIITLHENTGAEYVSMTGSGSSCYGIFSLSPAVEGLAPDWFVKMIEL